MKLLAELKRRNVIRMAGLYLVGAWLAVQVAATLLPVFEAPGWVMKVLVALLAAGFVAALVFSWVYELTPEGLKRDADVSHAESIAPQTARRMDRMIIVVLLLALAYFGLDRFVLAPGQGPSEVTGSAAPVAAGDQSLPESAPATAAAVEPLLPVPAASIAVLPFVNMSTDAENGFFADGISEELLNVLAGIEGLKVASRTSSFSFKGKDTAIPEIARQLEVRHVLEGSVRKQGTRVRITAQLIDASSDAHLWSKTFDRDLVDIFKVQEEIAQAITGELEAILGKRIVAVTASTADLEAYQDFLRGRARFHARDELLAAIDELGRAVAKDPAFAEAWIYLAATWLVAPGYHDESEVGVAKAIANTRSALAKAEALLPQHPMVLALRGQLKENEGDFIAALEMLEHSSALSLQDSNPMMWRGLLLLRTGYIAEAVTVLEAARKQDPLAGINNGYLAIAYLSAGQSEKAEATARAALAQGWRPALRVVAYDLAARGERERAVALLDEITAADPPLEGAAPAPDWRALLLDPARTQALAELDVDDQTTIIEIFIAIRRLDKVLDLAESILQQDRDDQRRQWWLRSAWLPSTLALREDPRFFALATRLGIVTMWEARGYPPGCMRVAAPGGDHLECVGPGS
jgi:adenylate cyclase